MKDNKIIDHIISELVRDFDALESVTDASKAGSIRRLATLVNSRNRLGKTIITVVLSKGDPRYMAYLNKSDDLAMIAKSISQGDIEKQPLMTHKSFHGRANKKRLSMRKNMKFVR